MGSVAPIVEVRVVVFFAVPSSVVSPDGEGLEEGRGEVLLQAIRREPGDRNASSISSLDIGFTRLIHGTEMDSAVLIAETALEWGVRRVQLGIDSGRSVAETEATSRVAWALARARWIAALARKCHGNEGECDEECKSELHVGYVDWWDRRLKAVTSFRESRSGFILVSLMTGQFFYAIVRKY